MFSLRTVSSRAPHLRSRRGKSRTGRWPVRLRLRWLRSISHLSNSPVLVKLAAGAVPLIVVGLGLAILAAGVGPYTIPPSHSVGLLLEQIGFGESSAPQTERAIIETIRLPRILLALTVGAALGVSGAVMQGLFRNPMADPGIIGVSTGGALGAVIAIALGLQTVFALALPGMAFVGAAAALALVYVVASLGGRFSMAALLLAGVALSAFMAAIISAIILFTSDLQAQREMLFWLAGGLGASTWTDIRISAPLVLIGIAVAVLFSRDLNLLMVSEDEAKALGVRVVLTRNLLLLAASLITGTAVAFSGAIAFVGLIAPHTLRLLIGADHRALIPLSAIGGGIFLLAADTLARVAIAPAEIPVGVVTALVGAPFFVLLLARNKARASML
ncbi:MAG: iron chelate uptake ABC transporter family permease subunit [Chloroflexi bacterium]|nr:iron chelate uptake ABC transporter family permease subunit [Chloroflexota bacterium]MYK60650.1 iron chelate uptake ABC transporter family permease subunit [Chloroflexota bacterium]